MVKLGEKMVKMHQGFRLFATTKLTLNKLKKQFFMNMTVIDFTISNQALQEVLLIELMRFENPEMEVKKTQINELAFASHIELKKKEEKILDLLSECDSNLLDKDELITQIERQKSYE